MIRVIIESPYGGDVDTNVAYLARCMWDCLVHRQETPYASHGLYTAPGCLDDLIPAERKAGIAAGFDWRPVAAYTVVYLDRGISTGMRYGIDDAKRIHHPIQYRAFLDGTDRPSYDVRFDQMGAEWTVDAPRLPGGCVTRGSIDAALTVLREIAKERRP